MEDSAGRESTLATMLGSDTLWEERYFAEFMRITCWRYLVGLEVLINFAGDKKELC